ncbi:MAG: MAPEG family protein [Alysiella sp.]|uniref:MAPEG family protein n=1 Tax=Alysiella sp. TaxID=1872483 RepID=UPI0026DD631A|nr:MAPEG family protein [Alysiella sp.]MDO4433948.1 MAPEG family protein [Alysiella sp.]
MTFAYFSIVIVMCLNWFCAAYAKKSGGFNFHQHNANPRDFLAQTTGKAARLNAAQQNGYEIFAPYAAAVIIAHFTGEASQFTLNFWAAVFILSRIGFIWAYAQNKAKWRSLLWSVGMVAILALFIAAF